MRFRKAGLFVLSVGAAAIGLFLVGCGGVAAGSKTAIVTGRITDIDGLPVRGARVSSRDSSTTSSSNGAYILEYVRSSDEAIVAELQVGTTTYRGQNLARTFEAEQTTNVNIMIAPTSQLAQISGTVEDRNGNLLEGASVFALGAGALCSARAVTDKKGAFELKGLIAGVNYTVSAGGRDYSSDEEGVTLRAHEDASIRFILGSPGFPSFAAPQWISTIAWTSPGVSRSPRDAAAYEQVKRLFDPKRTERKQTRLSGLGNPIEVELEWEPFSSVNLLGYNIYRGFGNAALSSIDLFREPLSGLYIDSDVNLAPNAMYRYVVSAVGTRFPDDPNAEGVGSDPATVNTLGDLVLGPVFKGPELSWRGGSGAASYIVYVFDRFPALGVTSFWNNAGSPTTEVSLTYSGPALGVGQTYYYLVLGLANSQQSRTISTVGSFIFQN